MIQVERNLAERGKTLVAGWFSFTDGHATAGDLLARDLVCEWLDSAGVGYDVALAQPFGTRDLESADPLAYSQVVFVCGPFEQGELEALLLTRFRHCKLIGVNLSMAVPLEQWDPFDLLLERDSARRTRPDIVFLSRQTSVPVVGVCLVEPHEGALDQIANAAIARLTSSREMAVVNIDTRLDQNSAGLRNPSEVEALIARMDVLITTRLHGTVLALKNGVPVIAIDPISGGAKIRRQAEAIRWPVVFTADALKDEELLQALRYCLSDAARERARRCAATAAATVETIRDAFIAALGMPHELPRSSQPRAGVKGRADWPAALTRDGAGDGASSECGRRRFKYRIETLLKRLTRYDA